MSNSGLPIYSPRVYVDISLRFATVSWELFAIIYSNERFTLTLRFVNWDINNEMLHGSYFSDHLGPNIRDWMYNTAADMDPKADLFINDFDAVENGLLTEV